MKVSKLEFKSTGIFSNTFLDYISGEEKLREFYSFYPDAEGFSRKIKDYSFDTSKRKSLHEVVQSQYKNIAQSSSLAANISSLLDEKTYTVTTGHQLNIFTGPLYFIYKIITVINLAKKLRSQFPQYNFVPVYWMASEDHDFEEINNFRLFGKKLVWQTDQRGAVGRFDPSGINVIFDQIQEQLPVFRKAYLEHGTLSAATRYLVNELFGKEGLVVLDADHSTLKSEFKQTMADELCNESAYKYTSETCAKLDALGYKPQVNPREINLFYVDDQLRERIVKENGSYKILNTSLIFSEKEFLDLLEREPQKFSPNVLLRPLYQETVLPNICYCGGPAELVYWLELKSLFSYHNVPFPILLPRNFVLYINKAIEKKIRKFGLSDADLFQKEDMLVSRFLSLSSNEIYKLEEEVKSLETLFEHISAKANKIDPTLVGYVQSEKQKLLKSVDDIEKKLKKAEQKKNADDIGQVTALKNKLFPENSLQERQENLLNFSINDPGFIERIMDCLDPLEFCFYVLSEENSDSSK